MFNTVNGEAALARRDSLGDPPNVLGKNVGRLHKSEINELSETS